MRLNLRLQERMGKDGWLDHYNFPAEARLQNDSELARQVYQGVVQTTLKAGTTTAVYFGTLHLQPTQMLVDIGLAQGQRAFVSKVCMDRTAPENYVQTLQQNSQETQELIRYIQTHPQNRSELVLPLIAPRFIPTCTPQLLTALGQLAAGHNCHVASHISKSLDEVAWSQHLDKEDHQLAEARTDAEVFHSHKLLTDRCIMVHGVHLSPADTALLKQQGAAIAHCPCLSNFCFAGGTLDCPELLRRGNKVGLGIDVAGGYNQSLMNAARMAIVASQSLCQQQQQADQPLDYRQAIYLATLGGAQALGLQDKIGTFRVGMVFDAIVFVRQKLRGVGTSQP